MVKTKEMYLSGIPMKAKTLVIGNGLYMSIPKRVRDAIGIEMKSGQIYHCNLIKYEPIKMRILNTYMNKHKVVEIESWNGSILKGYIESVNQAEATIIPVDSEGTTGGIISLPLIKTITYEDKTMKFNINKGELL